MSNDNVLRRENIRPQFGVPSKRVGLQNEHRLPRSVPQKPNGGRLSERR